MSQGRFNLSALAVRERSWIFDPAMQVGHDILDNKGHVIARAGQRVNPLDFVAIRQKLVFIDGDDRDQVNWALRRFDDRGAKLIVQASGCADLDERDVLIIVPAA